MACRFSSIKCITTWSRDWRKTGPTGDTGPTGPGVFLWGAEPTIIWADSSAPGPGTGTPSDPFPSLQSAVTAATTSTFANTYGMRARCIVPIAANSAFDEDIVIPPADPHQGQLNSYFYNSRINIINHNGLRIQRMVDCRTDGTITAAVYSEITNSAINGNVTVTAAASNYYFVNSGSTLVGAKTILFSLA